MAADLKSLAHPEWPYRGSPHEWRGFVKDGCYSVSVSDEEFAEIERRLAEPQEPTESIKRGAELLRTIYQKQNFGPELK